MYYDQRYITTSHRIVATCFRCGGTFDHYFATNLPL